MKYTVVTTFNKNGYDLYGKRMVESFLRNWPSEVTLYVYAEDCDVIERASNLIIRDLKQSSPEMVAFKERWKNDPRANGDISGDDEKSKRKDARKAFKWDAIRFAHKVYSIFACAKEVNSGTLIWMDGDVYCHSPITISKIKELMPEQYDVCYLGRGKKYPECGLYSLNLDHLATRNFLEKFEKYYEDAEHGIFTLKEWHDSYVFKAVLESVPMNNLDMARDLFNGEGHPLINTEWGAYLDHLKGSRKREGRSRAKDLRFQRNEAYWK